MPDKVSPSQFAASVKAKYPEYKEYDDLELTNAMVKKYPEYKEYVDFGTPQKAPAAASVAPVVQPTVPVSKYQKAVEDDRSEVGKFLSNLYNNTVGSFEKLAKIAVGLPAQFPVQPYQFSPVDIGGAAKSAREFAALPIKERLKPVKESQKGIEKAFDVVKSGYTTREDAKQMAGQFNVMDGIGLKDIEGLLSMSGGMAVDMGLGALTGGTTFVAQGMQDAFEDYDAAVEKAGIEPDANARGVYGMAGGIINGLLEKFAVDKLVGDTPVFKDIQKKAIANVLKNTAGMTGKKAVDAIETAAVAEIKKLTSDIKSRGVRAAYRTAVEGGTEAVQAALEDGAKLAANLVQGNEAFNEDEIKKGFLQNIVNSGIAGGIMGPIFGAAADKAFGRNVNTQVLKDISEANTPEQLAAINEELTATFDENNFTQEERDAIMANANRYAQIKQTLPAGTNPIAQTIAIPLIENRIKIDNEIQTRRNAMESVDEALKADEESAISLLEDKRSQINDDIREVVNNEKFDYFEKDGKFYKKLGENAPEEISKNRFDLQQLKTEGYATTTGQGPVQEGDTAGDISQRQGAQEGGTQEAPPQADTSYRYIVSEEGSEFPVRALVNKKVRKDGRPAILYQEGQRIVARILGTNRIEDVGNVVEMMDALPQDFGIEVDETVVTETPTGYRVEGEDMVNDSENPLDAISVDQNGNVKNVVLKTPSGKRRKFRGQAAQDLAYQITLKETLKNEDEFELFLEQEHQAELDAAEAKAAAEAETARANEPVPPVEEPTTEPVTGPTTEPTTEQEFLSPIKSARPSYGRVTSDNVDGLGKGKGFNKLQNKVLKDVKNVVYAIRNILESQGKEVSVNLHDQDSFEQAVIEAGGSKEDATSRGFYMDGDGSIHLNMDNLASDTMLHEGFHPILDFLEANDPKVINDFFAQLESIPGSEDIIAQARENYVGDVTQKKEAITDFVAGVADGRIVLNPSNFRKIRKFILDMLNKIGIGKGGGTIMEAKDTKGLIELANLITEDFTEGFKTREYELLDILADRKKIATGEQGLIAAAGQITPERISDSKIGNVNPLQFSRPEKFKEVETVSLPSKSMMDVYNEFGGNAVAINSDPTRVGNLVLPSGKEIFMYGGLNYTALKPNVDGEIGFASTRISKPEQVSRIMNSMFKDRNGEGVVLVAAQKPDSMLGNAYALEYTLDAITQLPKKILKSSEFKNEFFGKDIVAIKEAFGEKEYADFVKKYRGADLSNPTVMDDMIATLLTDIGNNFIARNSMVGNMLAGVVEKSSRAATKDQPGYVSVTPNKFIAKALYDRLGLNQEKLFYEIGEKGIVDEYMNNGNWGFVTTGFTSDGKINPRDIQDKGVVHPQFNAKFHGKNPFILDGAYLIDKLFPPEEIITKTGKPYTKKASLMVAGSMYPKGKIEKVEAPDTKGVPAFQRVPSEDVINGFYSPIKKRVNEFKLPNASAQKWKEIVGIKSDEAIFSGLTDWLNSKKPNEQISKEDINKFMKDNRIEIVEKTRGGDYEVYKPSNGMTIKYFDNLDDAEAFVREAKSEGDNYEINEPSGFLLTKYENYQLPGGENYKEILVTLPGKDQFKSSHFDETNIITHLRMNTRTDNDGKKVLFLEEVQSDWGQKGKKEGFGLSENDVKRLRELGYDYKDGKVGMYFGDNFVTRNYNDLVGEAAQIAKKAQLGVAPAPFVSNTNAWVKLGLKVALKEAVKQGADRIAWTTGDQQSDRFDLSKTIESIKAIRKARPIFSAKKGPVGPRVYTLKTKYKNGEEGQTDLVESELADAIGKDLADRIIADGGGEYSGLDLRVGGKGMKAFYGDAQNTGIVGNVAKALVKELTGNSVDIVESVIDTSAPIAKQEFRVENDPNLPMGRTWVVLDREGGIRARETNRTDAMNAMRDMTNRSKEAQDKGQNIQPAINITPELKISVKEGMPQFQKAPIKWEKSKEGKGDPSISSRNPIVVEAAKNLKAGKITNEEYRATVSANSPVTPITRFFEPATEQEIRAALNTDKIEKVNAPITDNTVVGLRLDIPAYKNKNTWVVSVHEGDTDNGPVISYDNVARITDVKFSVKPKGALGIATGVEKTTIGRMFGKWQNIDGATMEQQGDNAKALVQNIVNDPNYVQVGMNPFRHSYFYDRSSDMGRPIVSADEVIQIGGLVYAKNPEYGNWTDEAYRVKGLFDAAGAPVQFQKAPTKPITKGKLGGVKKTFKEQVRYGLLGKESVRLKEKMSGELSAELATAETRVQEAMKTIKKYGGAVTEKDISNFMEGKSSANQLPLDLATQLTEMRAQIDGLTERLIQLGVIDSQESIDYYRENKGKYLLRSYEAINFKENPLIASFTGRGLNIDNVAKKLKNVDQTVVNSALRYLSNRAKAKYIIENALKQNTVKIVDLDKDNYSLVFTSNGQGIAKIPKDSGDTKKEAAVDFMSTYLIDPANIQSYNDIKNTIPNVQLSDDAALEEAKIDANSILDNSESYVMSKGLTGSTNVKSLRQRKDLSPEIRALMGEYTDPLYNYYSTIFKISSLTSSRQYLNSLKEFGMGKFFFDKKTADATKMFAGEESEALKPLNGIYTFPEIYESLKIADKETAGLISQVAGRVRMFKTVYNPATHVKNIIGNMGFAVSNGHWTNIPEAYKYMRSAITGKKDEDIMNMMDTLNRYGVLNNVIGIGELKAYFDKNESVDDFLKTIYNNANNNTTASKLGKAKANLSKIPKAIEKAYAIEDDVFKILAFVNESNRYSKALFGVNYNKLSADQKKEIDNIASEIVKDTYPTFSRVPKGVKTLSKFAFLGNFLAFPVESVRTQYNSLSLAMKEIKSGNPKLKTVGYSRIGGALAYNSLFSTMAVYAYNLAGAGLTGAVGMLFGDDEEENETSNAIKLYVSDWNKNSEVYVSQFKDGILKYTDIGSLDSYGYQRKVWNAFFSTKNKKEFDQMMGSAIAELLDPWMTGDFVVENFIKLRENDNGLGQTIYNPEGKFMDRFTDASVFVGKQFGPGAVGAAIKIADSYQKGEYEKVMDEFGAQVFARQYTVDLNKRFQNYIYTEATDPQEEVGFKGRLSNAERLYTDAKRQKLSPLELSKKYTEALDAYKEILLKANEYYKAAALGGTNPKLLIESLKKSRIGRAEAIAIITGSFSKYDQAYIRK